MSSILVAAIFFIGLLASVLTPYASLLIYEWTSYLPPNTISYGPLADLPYPKIAALATFATWLLFQRRKFDHLGPALLLFIVYLGWIQVTTAYAVGDEWKVAWKHSLATKVIVMAIMLYLLADSRARLEAFFVVYAVALVYWATIGAVSTIKSGGGGYGQIGAGVKSLLSDGSVMAIALTSACCYIYWVSRHSVLAPLSKGPWLRYAAYAFIAVSVVFIIGTQARTGLVAIAAAGAVFLLKSKRRAPALLVLAAAGGVAFAFAPAEWVERMSTIGVSSDADQSTDTRLETWRWAWSYAREHPIFGGGFTVFLHLNWIDTGSVVRRFDSHSYFFEIMAEQGFVGLGCFLAIIATNVLQLRTVERRWRGVDEMLWASDIARLMQVATAAVLTGGLFVGIGHNFLMWDFLAVSAALPRIAAFEAEKLGLATARTAARAPRPTWRPASAPSAARG